MTQLDRDRSQEQKRSESTFASWLGRETFKCGWSFRELARRSDLSSATIADLLSSTARPTWELCARISQAFRMSPTTVFRKAGLLPAIPRTRDEILVEVLETLAVLPEGPILHEARESIRAVAQHAYHRTQGAHRDERIL
jgi:transcriptional regulator with XRE-family HTH domain